MAEAIEGTIDGVNASERGVGFILAEQQGWFNFSQFLPREHQEGLTIPHLPPELRKGQRVRFLFDTNKVGKRYIQVNADGSHEFTMLDAAPPSQNGGPMVYDPTAKSDAIQWAVCLKLAGELYIARCSRDDERSVATAAVLKMAWELFGGGPNGNGDPIKAEFPAPEIVRASQPVPGNRSAAVPSDDRDPGPEEPMPDAATV